MKHAPEEIFGDTKDYDQETVVLYGTASKVLTRILLRDDERECQHRADLLDAVRLACRTNRNFPSR